VNEQKWIDPVPPSTPESAILGLICIELERRHPGIIEDCLARAMTEAYRADVVRMRGPRTDETVRRNLNFAHAWLARLSMVAPLIGKPVKRKFWPPW
jgi:hypothetical protein